MAISAKGQLLAAKNRANQAAFAASKAPATGVGAVVQPPPTAVVPAVAPAAAPVTTVAPAPTGTGGNVFSGSVATNTTSLTGNQNNAGNFISGSVVNNTTSLTSPQPAPVTTPSANFAGSALSKDVYDYYKSAGYSDSDLSRIEQERAARSDIYPDVAAKFAEKNRAPAPVTESLGEKNKRQQAEFATKQAATDNSGFNSSAGRESEITQNLQEGLAQSPALFLNRDTFDKAYGFASADAGKKAILDTFFNANQPKADVGGIYNMLKGGQPVTTQVQNTANYVTAKTKFDLFSKYNGYGSEQLFGALKNGEIGSELSKDLLGNPAFGQARVKFQQYQNTQAINAQAKAASEINKQLNKTSTTDTISIEPTKTEALTNRLINTLESKGIDPVSFKEYMATKPAITEKAKELTSKTAEYKTLAFQRDEVLKNIKTEFPGMPIGAQIALAARRAQPINEQLRAMSIELEQMSSDLEYESKIAEKDFAYQEANRIDAREFSQAKELSIFNANIKLQGDQITQKYQTDRDTQAYVRELQKLGIKNITDLQDKKEDQAFQIQLEGIRQKYKSSQSVQDFNNDIAKLNLTNTAKTGTKSTGTQLTDGTSSQSIGEFTTSRKGSSNVQCGALSNDYWLSVTGKKAGMGDTLNDKYAALSDIGRSDTPVVGGLFVSNPLKNAIGHTGIVQSVNNDGSIIVREANANGSEAGGPAVSKPYSAEKVKELRFSVAPKSTTAQVGQYAESDIELLSTLANMDDSARNTAMKAQGISLKSVTDYMAKAKAGEIPTTQAQKNSSLDLMNIIQDLSSMDWSTATGFQVFDTPIRGTDRATATGKVENLVSQMVLPNLGMLKGPMSDKDIAFLKSASSKFDLTQSDKAFEKNLIEFYNILALKSGKPKIEKLKDIPKERIMSGKQPTTGVGATQSDPLGLFGK